jgi:hypothetical protein
MNDKILQLLVQSGLLINVSDHRVSELDPNIKKFAELIVRECCQFENSYSGDARLVSRHYGRRIREHFGVEE